MLFKTRLHINVAGSAITAVVIILVLFVALYQVDRAMHEADIAGDIITCAFERSTLRSDYLRTDSQRAKKQWFVKHEQMGRLLRSASETFRGTEDVNIIQQMIKDQDWTGKIFSDIVGNREKTRAAEGSALLSRETESRLVSQLEMRLYDKVLYAETLHEAAEKRLYVAVRLAVGSILCVIAVVTAAAIVNSWTMRRIFADRIERIRKGASAIGEGNLDYRIDIEGNDEFAELSGTFDAMTEKLGSSHLQLETQIAERQKAEEALRASEQKFRLFFEHTPAAVAMFDRDMRYILASRGWLASFGLGEQDLIGRSHYEVFPEIPDHWKEITRRCMAGAIEKCEEEPFHRLDGTIDWVRWEVRPWRENNGAIGGIVIFTEVITKRKQAEELLLKNEARLKRAQEMAHLGSWELDGINDTLTWSDEVYRIFGLRPREFGATYESFLEAVHPDDRAAVDAAYSGSLREGRDSYEIDHRVVRKSTGEIRYVHERCEHVRDGAGRIIRSAGMVHDITERKTAEIALQKLNEELEMRVAERTRELEVETAARLRAMEDLREKDRLMIQQSRMAAMGEMLGNIAHQWRQPLNILGLMIQDLGLSHECGDFSKESLDANIGKAMEIVLHLSQTIDDFSNFAAPDKEKSLFRVDQVIMKTISLVEDSFRSQRIAIEVTSSDGPEINGYPHEYAQVLLNILMNARDAFLEREVANARIAVRAWEEEGRSFVTITDNAGGIKADILDKVFEPYFTTKDLGKGSGVGLFMSKNLIEKNMGGRLGVRNTGDGAEFRIEV